MHNSYAAAMIPGSRLLDAPPGDISVEETLQVAAAYELCIIHTSTSSMTLAALRVR